MDAARRLFLKSAAAGLGCAMVRPRALARALSAPGFSPKSGNVREAVFYTPLGSGFVQCGTCPRLCSIAPGGSGHCGCKVNLDGKLYSVSYGNPCSVHVDPVEKKPLLHFLPGSQVFSLAVAGCNFHCLNCQNWEISQTTPDKTRNYDLPPEAVVSAALEYGCRGIAYTYSEPTTFYEYMLDTASLGMEKGLKSVLVSNGYMSAKAMERLCGVISGAALNLKAFSEKTHLELTGGHLAPVLETLQTVKKAGVWLEIIHLMVPTHTDNPEEFRRLCAWVKDRLGPETPLHISRFHPKYRLVHLAPTPVDTLEKARGIALAEGLRHVYLGNVPGGGDKVLCAGCGKTLVVRDGYMLLENRLKNGRCPDCGREAKGVWQ
jgi:pyruvate formate lyase activating enzyme